MCIRCHNDPHIVKQLQDALQNPCFPMWNITSFSHILIIISGYNGSEAHQLAIMLAEKFYQWCCSTRIPPFEDTDKLREEIDNAVAYYRNQYTTQQIGECVYVTE